MGSWTGVILTLALIGVSHCYEDKTVLQYLIDNGYNTFVQYLHATKQDTELGGPGPYTVFAPTDAAFAKQNAEFATQMTQHQDKMKTLVKYHLVKNLLLIPVLPNVDHLVTMAGQKLDFVHLGHSVILNNNTRVDAAPHNDIICSNGVIQPIDNVLLPPNYDADNLIAVLLERDNLFMDFSLSLMLTNLTSIIESGEYTLFAPTNAAYGMYYDNILHPRFPLQRQRQAFYEVLKYHLVPGARFSSMLKNGQSLPTLHGTSLNVTVLNTGILLDNHAHIIDADIPASNGVIHVVDQLMFPGDLLKQLQKEYWAAHPTTPQTPSG